MSTKKHGNTRSDRDPVAELLSGPLDAFAAARDASAKEEARDATKTETSASSSKRRAAQKV